MSADPEGRQYGKVSTAVMVLTVAMMLLLVAAIVLVPYYEAYVSGPASDKSYTGEIPEPGEMWVLPETVSPPPGSPE